MIKADSKYKIEDAVSAGRSTKYPWLTMKVGESFPVENSNNAHTLACAVNKRYAPKKFAARLMSDRTIRVFRIK